MKCEELFPRLDWIGSAMYLSQEIQWGAQELVSKLHEHTRENVDLRWRKFSSETPNPRTPYKDAIFEEGRGWKVQKSICSIVILDGNHFQNVLKRLRGKVNVSEPDTSLLVLYVGCLNEVNSEEDVVVSLSNLRSTPYAICGKGFKFVDVDVMKVLLRYNWSVCLAICSQFCWCRDSGVEFRTKCP